jgi:hypothetical protein
MESTEDIFGGNAGTFRLVLRPALRPGSGREDWICGGGLGGVSVDGLPGRRT